MVADAFCAGLLTTESGTVMNTVTVTPTWLNPAASHTLTWGINPSSNVTSAFYGQYARLLTIAQPGTYVVTLVVSNISGTSTATSKTLTVYDCAAVGIAENNNLMANLNVYPNPAHEVVNVTLPSSISDVYKIKLVNVLGAVVYEETVTKGNASINLSGKAKGIYFLSVEANNQKATKKIVVE
jgi:hypothetical protein